MTEITKFQSNGSQVQIVVEQTNFARKGFTRISSIIKWTNTINVSPETDAFKSIERGERGYKTLEKYFISLAKKGYKTIENYS